MWLWPVLSESTSTASLDATLQIRLPAAREENSVTKQNLWLQPAQRSICSRVQTSEIQRFSLSRSSPKRASGAGLTQTSASHSMERIEPLGAIFNDSM